MPFHDIKIDDLAKTQIAALLTMARDIGPVPSRSKERFIGLLRQTRFTKSPSYVRSTKTKVDEYDAIWNGKTIEGDFSSDLNYRKVITKIVSDGRIKMATRWWLNAAMIVVLASKIREQQPRSVIEAGSGNGINLIALAAIFPDVDFTGLELTSVGVLRAQAAVRNESAVRNLVRFVYGNEAVPKVSFPLQNVQFKQHDLTKPSDQAKGDIVFTSLALEQMEPVFEEAFQRIIALSNRHCLFFEPFLEFNPDLTKAVLKSKNYLLRSFGDEIRNLGLSGDLFSMPRGINKLKFKFGVCEIAEV